MDEKASQTHDSVMYLPQLIVPAYDLDLRDRHHRVEDFQPLLSWESTASAVKMSIYRVKNGQWLDGW
jgi:hypothetical protein